MKLPNYERAVVSRAKVADYLLSEAHRDGKHKAVFFKRFGFAAEEWAILAQALQQQAAGHEVTRVEASPYGQRYILEGPILSPDGRHLLIRTVWFIQAFVKPRRSGWG
jgi:hypothetical protein